MTPVTPKTVPTPPLNDTPPTTHAAITASSSYIKSRGVGGRNQYALLPVSRREGTKHAGERINHQQVQRHVYVSETFAASAAANSKMFYQSGSYSTAPRQTLPQSESCKRQMYESRKPPVYRHTKPWQRWKSRQSRKWAKRRQSHSKES